MTLGLVARYGTEDHITEYFTELFTSKIEQPNQEVLSLVRRRVSTKMNNALSLHIRPIRKALFDIEDLKAPGPDVLQSIFYKRF